MGSQVLVPFRGSKDSHRHLKLMGDLGQIVPMKYNLRDEDSIKAVMAKANVIINLIGRDYETRNFSFEEVNHSMAQQLATISKEHGGILRFIQVSCLRASSSSPSRFLRTKAVVEEAVLSELPEATVLRPAVMVGTEDRILNPWAFFAKKYGFLLLVGDGSTKCPTRRKAGKISHEKSSTSLHLEELEDPKKFAEEGGKVITGQEYVSRLHELKAELTHAWHADDHVTP